MEKLRNHLKALKCIKNDDKEDGGIGPRKKRGKRGEVVEESAQ